MAALALRLFFFFFRFFSCLFKLAKLRNCVVVAFVFVTAASASFLAVATAGFAGTVGLVGQALVGPVRVLCTWVSSRAPVALLLLSRRTNVDLAGLALELRSRIAILAGIRPPPLPLRFWLFPLGPPPSAYFVAAFRSWQFERTWAGAFLRRHIGCPGRS